MHKVVANADEAIHDIKDGDTLMIGGFGLCGIPENLIRALVKKGVKDLHTISNNVGIDDFGLGFMLAAGQIKSHKGSYVGENRLLEEMVLTGRIDLELQGVSSRLTTLDTLGSYRVTLTGGSGADSATLLSL